MLVLKLQACSLLAQSQRKLFSAALLCLEDLSLRVTAVTLHVATKPEHYPRLRKLFDELVDLMQICEDEMAIYPNP